MFLLFPIPILIIIKYLMLSMITCFQIPPIKSHFDVVVYISKMQWIAEKESFH